MAGAIVIGDDDQPETGAIVIGSSGPGDGAIVIGEDIQPDAGGAIVIGTSGDPPAGEAALLEFTIPTLRPGTVMLIVIVHADALMCTDPSWARDVDAIGGAGVFLSAFVRTADGTEGGSVVSFLSTIPEELQGSLLTYREALADTLIYATSNAAFAGEESPPAPSVEIHDAEDLIVSLWSVEGDVAMTRPSGTKRVEVYSSSELGERTLLVASRRAGELGPFSIGLATADPAATGRAFSLALVYVAPEVIPTAPEPSTAAADLNATARVLHGPLLDVVLDPVTLDYVDTEDGEWLETADSRAMVQCELDIELEADIYIPNSGSRIRRMIEDGTPLDEELAAETRRALQVLADEEGAITDVTVSHQRDADGTLLIDCGWRDVASGLPLDLRYQPFGV
jgi:hypothetical protein